MRGNSLAIWRGKMKSSLERTTDSFKTTLSCKNKKNFFRRRKMISFSKSKNIFQCKNHLNKRSKPLKRDYYKLRRLLKRKIRKLGGWKKIQIICTSIFKNWKRRTKFLQYVKAKKRKLLWGKNPLHFLAISKSWKELKVSSQAN